MMMTSTWVDGIIQGVWIGHRCLGFPQHVAARSRQDSSSCSHLGPHPPRTCRGTQFTNLHKQICVGIQLYITNF